MYSIKVIKTFADKLCNDHIREVGDVYEVSKERGDMLIELGYAELVSKTDDSPAEVDEPKKSTRGSKKKA